MKRSSKSTRLVAATKSIREMRQSGDLVVLKAPVMQDWLDFSKGEKPISGSCYRWCSITEVVVALVWLGGFKDRTDMFA